MNSKEQEQDYDYERTDKDEWISDNLNDLMAEFIKAHNSEYIELLDEVIIDETYDLEYWNEVFCKEEMEQDFLDYCDEEYGNWRDREDTDRSYRRY